MSDYTLYMDESETYNSSGNRYFIMSGVIIKNSNYTNIENALNIVKNTVWEQETGCEQYILHEKDVTFANNRQNLLQIDIWDRSVII